LLTVSRSDSARLFVLILTLFTLYMRVRYANSLNSSLFAHLFSILCLFCIYASDTLLISIHFCLSLRLFLFCIYISDMLLISIQFCCSLRLCQSVYTRLIRFSFRFISYAAAYCLITLTFILDSSLASSLFSHQTSHYYSSSLLLFDICYFIRLT
jgi:hypothetical protein